MPRSAKIKALHSISKIQCINDDDCDSNYENVKCYTPKSRGRKIESRVIKNIMTSCCNAKIMAARVNQTVYDGICSKCEKKIQIKSTSQQIADTKVCITQPSLIGTITSPVSIYKFTLKAGKISRFTIFSPIIKNKAPYYRQVSSDPWNNPILQPTENTIVKSGCISIARRLFDDLEFL